MALAFRNLTISARRSRFGVADRGRADRTRTG